MRLLFVSSTTVGGSGRSQRELARLLTERGHEVRFLADDDRRAPVRRWWYEQCSDLSARWSGHPGARLVRWIEGLPGRRTATILIGEQTHIASPVPENAFGRVVETFRPDVVVGNSIIRLAWRKIRAECTVRGIATVLYVREVTTYLHLESMIDPADALVANATSLAAGAEQRGHSCVFVPSLIDVTPTMVEPSRRVALLINPIPSHGIDLLWKIARRLPDVPFVIRESWPLDPTQRAAVDDGLEHAPNVEFRPRTSPGPDLFAEARVLLTPHRIDNRPRVVVEAQANGIPVIASDQAGLREVVGPGGMIVGTDDLDAWVGAIKKLWYNDAGYAVLCDSALLHAQRVEISPTKVGDDFEAVLSAALDRVAADATSR